MKHTWLLAATVGLIAPLAAWKTIDTSENHLCIPAEEMIGKMKLSEFMMRNKKGGEMVAAIKGTSTALNATDKMLMDKVVMGGMKQLMIAQAVQGRIMDREAKILAESELEEQTGLDAKLKELGGMKGYTAPAEAMQKAEEAGTMFRNMGEGKKLDHEYVMMSGVKNHQKLLETMTMVKAQATDPALKALANATLPVIKMHLNVSQQIHPRLMAAAGGKSMKKA